MEQDWKGFQFYADINSLNLSEKYISYDNVQIIFQIGFKIWA